MLTRFYRRPSGAQHSFPEEECFYIKSDELNLEGFSRMTWVSGVFGLDVSSASLYRDAEVVEIGPKLSFETALSAVAVASARNMGVSVQRIERSVRYPHRLRSKKEIIAKHLDPMLQMVYPASLTSFDSGQRPEPLVSVPVLSHGVEALREANKEFSLGLDSDHLEYYVDFFRRLKHDPTDAELAFFANADSNHSRHHDFRGIRIIDGVRMEDSLMDLIKRPYRTHPGRNLVAFHDNAGVVVGWKVPMLLPSVPGTVAPLEMRNTLVHLTATAETHNHPTEHAPFPGAETGVGGRIRDNRAVGRGSFFHAGVAGYCVGSLETLRPSGMRPIHVPGIPVRKDLSYPYANPVEVISRGSSGVADYGNKMGEPLVGGFAREFGRQRVGPYDWEFVKPVLYSGGIGFLSGENLRKCPPQKGMLVLQIGGPTYRIGVGGGAASSAAPGANTKAMNDQSVQRGDAERENCANRVIQTCTEMGPENPILSIHDQGAGGILNVLTELVAPAGADIDFAKVVLGDQTLSDREIGSAESQERYALLLWKKDLRRFQAICARERVNCEVLGRITGIGRIIVRNSARGTILVDLPLKEVLEDRPRKVYTDEHRRDILSPLVTPKRLSIARALSEVFWLLQVCSKEFKVDKADTTVGGLVAQGPRVGPLHLPLADCSVVAASHFALRGVAEARGENANRMLVNPAAGARMALAETIANMMGTKITRIEDIAYRVNWMWPAKFPGEGAALWDTAVAVSEFMQFLKTAPNGGKDSFSMAELVDGTPVLSPRELVIMGLAPVPDVRKVVTPDLRGDSVLGLIDLSGGRRRLGGSAFAQVLRQVGNDCPDIDDRALFKRTFRAVQTLVGGELISAYHDVSDGGLIVNLAEMCFAGDRGAQVELPGDIRPFPELFCEEMRMVIEYPRQAEHDIEALMRKMEVPFRRIGMSGSRSDRELVIKRGREKLFAESVGELRRQWQLKSDIIKTLQSNAATAQEERKGHGKETPVPYKLTFKPMMPSRVRSSRTPCVAILREEGTNGDVEMAAAFRHAGFSATVIPMSDIREGRVRDLHSFRGTAAAGGFSFADVWGSGRAWAAGIRFDPRTKQVFDAFFERPDTFSLGVCNGFQLMTVLGLPLSELPLSSHPQLIRNRSESFESRCSAVKVLPGPSIYTRGMEGSVWSISNDHGEGRMALPDPRVAEYIRQHHLVPLAFVDASGEPTERYPANPNGSPWGWAGLCSRDGRHLGLMPHPERSVLSWQSSWTPPQYRDLDASLWLQMFVNIRDWC